MILLIMIFPITFIIRMVMINIMANHDYFTFFTTLISTTVGVGATYFANYLFENEKRKKYYKKNLIENQ
ncbi:hypothetical protein FBY54_0120 [Zymomonas mobilis]|uniref:Uncharacterized protein n=1 Tax=Zymomonas mobilis subsp. mobilis (strain ATCC 10988 / DSM 424 / LMG 404 / NCIMB 8938 / NRRL B-806 / ZM1) TaxID=555217 RepID=A0A0H3G793_ZYMMA|nr:hypothetical protein Zmob_1187 [Zymomonas mobilis subsp. mobilis ATCC 10988]TQL27374.1 hypothetical protein FBY55_0688 [Zymomonas mobilis]TQL29317.1 hypothetical protein FBY54_0120 [Zymomonas mobilis]